MTRTAIADGRWFDRSKAISIEEGTYFNGNNHISNATGSQWNHERLYLTASGTWVLNEWSQYQGSGESYTAIVESDAADWLVKNERMDSIDDLPESIRESLKTLFDSMEA